MKIMPGMAGRTAAEAEHAAPANGPLAEYSWREHLAAGGLALLAWLALTLAVEGAGGEARAAVNAAARRLGLALAWAFNYPHFVAACRAQYASPSSIRRHAIHTVLAPLFALFAAMLAIQNPARVLPGLCKFAFFWLGFHFSRQTLDLCLYYAARTGLVLRKPERAVLGVFIFSSFLYPWLRAEAGPQAFSLVGVFVPALGLPGACLALGGLVLTLSAAALPGLFFLLRARHGRTPSALLFLPALAQAFWLVPAASAWLTPGDPCGAFDLHFALFGVFHGLQYLWRSQSAPESGVAPRGVLTALGWFAGGALLFAGLPAALGLLGQPEYLAAPACAAAVILHHCLVSEGLVGAGPAAEEERALDGADLEGAS